MVILAAILERERSSPKSDFFEGESDDKERFDDRSEGISSCYKEPFARKTRHDSRGDIGPSFVFVPGRASTGRSRRKSVGSRRETPFTSSYSSRSESVPPVPTHFPAKKTPSFSSYPSQVHSDGVCRVKPGVSSPTKSTTKKDYVIDQSAYLNVTSLERVLDKETSTKESIGSDYPSREQQDDIFTIKTSFPYSSIDKSHRVEDLSDSSDSGHVPKKPSVPYPSVSREYGREDFGSTIFKGGKEDSPILKSTLFKSAPKGDDRLFSIESPSGSDFQAKKSSDKLLNEEEIFAEFIKSIKSFKTNSELYEMVSYAKKKTDIKSGIQDYIEMRWKREYGDKVFPAHLVDEITLKSFFEVFLRTLDKGYVDCLTILKNISQELNNKASILNDSRPLSLQGSKNSFLRFVDGIKRIPLKSQNISTLNLISSNLTGTSDESSQHVIKELSEIEESFYQIINVELAELLKKGKFETLIVMNKLFESVVASSELVTKIEGIVEEGRKKKQAELISLVIRYNRSKCTSQENDDDAIVLFIVRKIKEVFPNHMFWGLDGVIKEQLGILKKVWEKERGKKEVEKEKDEEEEDDDEEQEDDDEVEDDDEDDEQEEDDDEKEKEEQEDFATETSTASKPSSQYSKILQDSTISIYNDESISDFDSLKEAWADLDRETEWALKILNKKSWSVNVEPVTLPRCVYLDKNVTKSCYHEIAQAVAALERKLKETDGLVEHLRLEVNMRDLRLFAIEYNRSLKKESSVKPERPKFKTLSVPSVLESYLDEIRARRSELLDKNFSTEERFLFGINETTKNFPNDLLKAILKERGTRKEESFDVFRMSEKMILEMFDADVQHLIHLRSITDPSIKK